MLHHTKVKSGTNVVPAISQILNLAGIFGYTNIAIDKEAQYSHPKYATKKWRTLYCCFIIIILIILPPIHLRFTTVWNYFDLVQMFGYSYWIAYSSWGAAFSIGTLLYYKTKTTNALNKISYNASVIKYMTQSTPKTNIKGNIIISCTIFIVIAIVSYNDFDNLCTLKMYSLWFQFLAVLFFGAINLIVASLLNELGTYLINISSFFHSDIELEQDMFNKENVFHTIKLKKIVQKSRIIYHDLFEICDDLNKISSNTNFWLITHMVLTTIQSVYYRIRLIKTIEYKNMVELWYITKSAAWIVHSWILIWLIILPCEQVASEGYTLFKIINKLMTRSRDKELTKELWNFSYLLEKEKIVFSPHGWFSLKKGTVLTIIGLSVSYVFVLTELP